MYPFDHWWRKKYNVPFGSKKHKDACFIDMVIEFKEDLYFKNLLENKPDTTDSELELDRMIESEGVSLKSTPKVFKINKKDLDKEFESINLDDYNDPENI